MFPTLAVLLVHFYQIDSLVNEGNRLQERLQYSEAANTYRRALALAESTRSDSHTRALALHNLATSEYRQGFYDDAYRDYLESIRIWEGLGRKKDLASGLTNFAELCHARGNDAEALKFSTRALALQSELGSGSPNALTIHGNVLRGVGRFEEARQILRRSVAQTADDPSWPRATFALTSLAQAELSGGHFYEARAAAQKAADIWATREGREHLQYANAIALLARISRAEGDLNSAERQMRQSLAGFERALGSQHPRLVAALADLADVLGRRRRLEEAQRILLRAEALARQVLGERHPDYAAVLLALGDQYRSAAQLSDAESYYRRALPIAEAAYGESGVQMAPYLNNYATALFDLGRRAESEQWYRRALAAREKALGPMHIENAETLLNLSVICIQAGRYEEGRTLIERSLAIRQQFYGDSHPSLIPGLNTYSHILQNIGDKKRAKEVSSMARAILASQPESRHTVDVKALRSFR